MKLYYSPGACSQAPHILLHEIGLSHDAERVDLKAKRTEDGADYLKLNAKGAVPALQLDSGEVLTENAVILQFLGDRTSWPEVLPPMGDFRRYRVLEAVNFITTELHKRFGMLFNRNAGEDTKALVIGELEKKLELYRRRARRRAVPVRRAADASRSLSVRDHRLGGKDARRPRSLAAPQGLPRADDAAGLGPPRASLRRIARGATRGLERPPMTGQFDLTDDQLQIQEMARKFTADAITPFAAEWDEKHIFPKDVIREAAELGFGSIYVSEESGGIGLGRLEAALIMEAMAYGCPSTSAFISIHNMASWMIDRFGSAEVKQKYLPSMITMERMGSYCLTEPSSGSDAAALKTKAVLDGDHYVVSGSKAFISGGGENEVYVTMVRTGEDGPKGISCLVIDKDMPGVSFGAQEKKLGWHSQPTAQVNFDEVRVPVTNRVGAEGEGFRIAMMGLDGGRLNIGACSLGGAQRCLDEAVNYTKERKQFGQPIADFQATQFTLADMETELQAARYLLYVAAAKVTANAPDKTRFAAMAKRLATDTGSSIVDRALQLHGGYGYLQDYPIERFWRDLRVHSILEGTNQIMRVIVSRDLLRQ